VELLRERVGKPVNYDNLAQSLSISPPTAKSWVELLEKLYIHIPAAALLEPSVA